MNGFKLFVESAVSDLQALCKDIFDTRNQEQQYEKIQLLGELFPELIDNDLKNRALQEVLKKFRTPMYDNALMSHFVIQGMSGFASFSGYGYFNYTRHNKIPSLRVHTDAIMRDEEMIMASVPIKKSIIDKAIQSQMGLQQYIMERMGNKLNISDLELNEISIDGVLSVLGTFRVMGFTEAEKNHVREKLVQDFDHVAQRDDFLPKGLGYKDAYEIVSDLEWLETILQIIRGE
jgi:hypothetical protein